MDEEGVGRRSSSGARTWPGRPRCDRRSHPGWPAPPPWTSPRPPRWTSTRPPEKTCTMTRRPAMITKTRSTTTRMTPSRRRPTLPVTALAGRASFFGPGQLLRDSTLFFARSCCFGTAAFFGDLRLRRPETAVSWPRPPSAPGASSARSASSSWPPSGRARAGPAAAARSPDGALCAVVRADASRDGPGPPSVPPAVSPSAGPDRGGADGAGRRRLSSDGGRVWRTLTGHRLRTLGPLARGAPEWWSSSWSSMPGGRSAAPSPA